MAAPTAPGPAFAAALLTGIALTRHAKGIDTLIALVATESALAEPALEAMATANFSNEVRERLAAAIQKTEGTRIRLSYQTLFPH